MKIALIIGINYIGTSAQLFGCIHDAMNVKNTLMDHYDYQDENITLITDQTDIKPTKDNILCELMKLLTKVYSSNEITNVWISYSGHGSYILDKNGDENDGRDEVIVSSDLKFIPDDVLNHVINLIQLKVKCVCLFDSCHSGTVLDLPYMFNEQTQQLESVSKENGKDNDCILISGCKDNQLSQEAWIGNGKTAGAMTTIFLYLIQRYNYNISWETLIIKMNSELNLYGFSQQPRLTCNRLIDTKSIIDL